MHITYIYPVIIQNKGYAPGLALGRHGVSSVSQRWLRDLLLHEDLLLVLLDHLLELSIDNDFATEPSDLCPLFNGKVLGHPHMLRPGERWHWRLRRPHGTPADLSTRPTLT